MKMLDLFCGIKSMAKAFEAAGLRNKTERARIPQHIVEICKGEENGTN